MAKGLDTKSDWTIRRRIIVGTLIYCAVMGGQIIFYKGDASIFQALATLAIAVIGSYVFGAAYDDKK